MNEKKRYQAHKAEVERIMEIPEGQRTNEEIEFLTDDADAKEGKNVNNKKRRQAHKAEVERIMKIPEGERTNEEKKYDSKRRRHTKRTEANDAPLEKKAKTKAPLVNSTMISAGFADSSLGLVLACSHGRIVVRAVNRTICKRPVRVGDVLVDVGYGTMKLIGNDVGFRQVLSVLKTAPRPLYLGFVRGS